MDDLKEEFKDTERPKITIRGDCGIKEIELTDEDLRKMASYHMQLARTLNTEYEPPVKMTAEQFVRLLGEK